MVRWEGLAGVVIGAGIGLAGLFATFGHHYDEDAAGGGDGWYLTAWIVGCCAVALLLYLIAIRPLVAFGMWWHARAKRRLDDLSRSGFRVLDASYGAALREADVTAQVREKVGGGSLDVLASNALCAGDDPAPGQVKSLTVQYELGGVRLAKTVREHERLVLP